MRAENEAILANLNANSTLKEWQQLYRCCQICPQNCQVNRLDGELGFCLSGTNLHIARAALHFYEEPPISGTSGSGAIFFTGCNLSCVFCQNCAISTSRRRKNLRKLGKEFSQGEFVKACLDLEAQGACNINLVTAGHQLASLIPALYATKEAGIQIPFVYNSSSYESLDMLKKLSGLIDIYLPDIKFYQASSAKKYLGFANYPEISFKVVDEMYRQVGKLQFANKPFTKTSKPAPGFKLLKKGLILRILLMPGFVNEAKAILAYAYTLYGDNIYLSLMNQYTPIPQILKKYPELNRHVLTEEYEEFVDFAINLGVKHAFTQAATTQSESFIPDFQIYNDDAKQ
ncbi:radical SAM protein [Amygdalobacter nucleatus]|uniref:radical SAM protein n=1 Tax=Amygdalobacter nucleatus TaxID=3029274 RepID=UPI00279FCF20|nr:radical SAM protein [Amygdalobacter nucleatus]WEG36392.1 radical SAM protein [Amygdalobacter nucleatus]